MKPHRGSLGQASTQRGTGRKGCEELSSGQASSLLDHLEQVTSSLSLSFQMRAGTLACCVLCMAALQRHCHPVFAGAPRGVHHEELAWMWANPARLQKWRGQ